MELKLFNTLTRKKEIFKPIKKDFVKMYVCGPTVNDVPHLGHARQQVTFDILKRYLKFLGMKVISVSNITDIDDKIIKKANELNEDIKKLTERNFKLHMEDYEKMNVGKPDVQPRATEYIPEMINLIERLEKKGYTYVTENDGVYYDVSKFKEYGKLSHQKTEDLISGKRVNTEGKKNKEDFVLWKFSKPGEPSWNSPWGKGRPGWHIECSAMSEKILGLPFDIHGGGQDLIFPHHEDEIAQSEAATGKKFVNYWIHNGMVNVNKVKMSKSLGNFKTIRDLLKEYSPEIIRYFIISSHYRKPVDFSNNGLNDAKNSYERLKNITSKLEDENKINEKYLEEFKKSMNDDLNTPKALQVLWKMVRDENAKGKSGTIKKIDEVFGLNLINKEKTKEERKIIEERKVARKNKNYAISDKLREELEKRGYIVQDDKNGFWVSGTRINLD